MSYANCELTCLKVLDIENIKGIQFISRPQFRPNIIESIQQLQQKHSNPRLSPLKLFIRKIDTDEE
jgi:hypothetical protein